MCAGTVFASACAKSSEDSPLQASDLVVSTSAKFDPNDILDLASLEDAAAFDAAAIQAFLEKTSYRRASFLATYQSNGVRASDALARAATANRINPLVMLVRAQALQGLVGSEFYPFPSARVEYVFRCGCSSADMCDPSSAGFDRQATCLAQQLRKSLDQIAATGATTGSWGPGKVSVSLDNQKITPKDAATAALYQANPSVGTGQSDEWLFWNIWQNYADFLSYISPNGGSGGGGGSDGGTGTPTGTWIGDACTSDAMCSSVPGGVCNTSFPQGMCMTPCTGTCPTAAGRPASYCADFGTAGGYCLPTCDADVASSCRANYECRPIQKVGDPSKSAYLCAPPAK